MLISITFLLEEKEEEEEEKKEAKRNPTPQKLAELHSCS